jgi:hypothetical protein
MSREERHQEVRVSEEAVSRGLVLRAVFGALALAAVLSLFAGLLLAAREGRLRPSHRFPEGQLGAPRDVAGLESSLFEAAPPGTSAIEVARARLHGYGWVDRRRRIVHIPIERAIELVLGQGGRP